MPACKLLFKTIHMALPDMFSYRKWGRDAQIPKVLGMEPSLPLGFKTQTTRKGFPLPFPSPRTPGNAKLPTYSGCSAFSYQHRESG